MSAMNDACARWIALSDREALGEALTAEEREFSRMHAAACTACRIEARLWSEMEALVDRPTEHAPAPEEHPAAVVPRRRARWRWLVGAGAIAASAAAAVFILAGNAHDETTAPAPTAVKAAAPADARVILAMTSGGSVEIDGRPGIVGERLERGAVLFAREGSACVVVEKSVRSCVARGSLLRVADLGEHRRFELLGGKISVELEPQAPGTSFGISTRGGAAIAIGTAFSVEVPPGDAPVVTRVLHGKVVVRGSNGAEQRVAAHEMTSMTDAKPSALTTADEERERGLLTVPTTDERTAYVRIETDVPGALVTIDERAVGVTPIALLLSPGEHAVAIEAPARAMVRETLHVGDEPIARRFDLPAAPAAPPSTGAVDAGASSSAAELLVAARERRARGDLDGSVAAYRELFARHGTSAEAHTALVPWGELQLSRLSDPHGALASFDRYLARGGSLDQEASFGRIRALRVLGRAGEERAAIEAFVRRFPEGPVAASLRQRLESIENP